MGTGNRRDQLLRNLENAKRDLEAAKAAVHPSRLPGDRPPNDAVFTRLEVAQSTFEAAELALQECDRESDERQSDLGRFLNDFDK